MLWIPNYQFSLYYSKSKFIPTKLVEEKKLITNKANESRPQVEPHLTMSSNDI